MSNVVVIPARLGSTRLSRKALADIEGSPMVVRVAERAAKASGVSRIIVATDSEEILTLVKRAGFEAQMTPESLRSGTDRVAYIAKDLKESVIINLQGDEPVFPILGIEVALSKVIHDGAVMGSAFTPFTSISEMFSPSNVKVITDQDQNAIYFSRSPIPFRQNPVPDEELLKQPHFGKHMGIYVYQRDFLLKFSSWEPCFLEQAESLEQLRAVYRGIKIGMGFSPEGSQSVDTAEDLESARRMYREQSK